jgi:hypothetical protein
LLGTGQRGQLRHARAHKTKILKSLEASQRGQVRHACPSGQVEILKSLDASQRGQVRELRSFSVRISFLAPRPVGLDAPKIKRPEPWQASKISREPAQSQIAEV